MANVLFLSIPSHGHMNPTMGLASALINQGEKVTFFSSNEFKKPLEELGADFKCYKEDLNIFQKKQPDPNVTAYDEKKAKPATGLIGALLHPGKFIDDVLEQIQGSTFDYIIFSAAYPYAQVIAQILNIPAVSSFAVFVTLKELFNKNKGKEIQSGKGKGPFGISPEIIENFKEVRQNLIEKYHVEIPEDIMSLLFNKGDLNIIYTSKYFIRNIDDYDDSFIFIGPPIYQKKYTVDFPFDRISGKKVIYISMGTVFGDYSTELNNLFFKSFADVDAIVIMAAHNVDISQFDIPKNFIIRDYVPQLELLKYTSVAITHAGMNSIGDLLYNNVPFVAIPLGADQFYMANRAQELGTTIVLDLNNLTPDTLKNAVDKVLTDPAYLENIRKISDSFVEAGGYKKAVEEIFKLKQTKGILK